MRAPDPFIGRDILDGQFQILQKMGSGGMGAVYKALQPSMNRMVGMKILHRKLANRNDLVSRFKREARAMSHLTHPNTVKVFLFGELEDGSLYIVMEFLEGKNLNQTVRAEGPFPDERALPVLIQACGALDEAHKPGMIHRDSSRRTCSSASRRGCRTTQGPRLRARQGDRARDAPRSHHPHAGGDGLRHARVHEPRASAGKSLTPASDIYSLAVILYEVLTGKLPFEAKTAMDYIQAHVNAKPSRSPSAPGKEFPPLLSPGDRARAREEAGRALRERGRLRDGDAGGARRSEGGARVSVRSRGGAGARAAASRAEEEGVGAARARADVDEARSSAAQGSDAGRD